MSSICPFFNDSQHRIESASFQMTIFYGGQAHVFDKVHPNKVCFFAIFRYQLTDTWLLNCFLYYYLEHKCSHVCLTWLIISMKRENASFSLAVIQCHSIFIIKLNFSYACKYYAFYANPGSYSYYCIEVEVGCHYQVSLFGFMYQGVCVSTVGSWTGSVLKIWRSMSTKASHNGCWKPREPFDSGHWTWDLIWLFRKMSLEIFW